MILKPLDQAIKDNDVIRSVIVASGINQDGRTPGITMPSRSQQGIMLSSAVAGTVLVLDTNFSRIADGICLPKCRNLAERHWIYRSAWYWVSD